MKTVKYSIGGMTCMSCQNRIEKRLRKTKGIASARVSYSDGTAVISYDANRVVTSDIEKIIKDLGYQVLSGKESRQGRIRVIAVLVLVIAGFLILNGLGLGGLGTSRFPLAEEGMGYGMLFLIGLITSVHCLAMCGGINLSQCMPAADGPESDSRGQRRRSSALRPSLFYNLSRVLSYTIVGAIVGALGAVITPSGGFKGVVQLIAGVFMVVMGLNMLGVFPGLRKLTPHMPRFLAKRIEKGRDNSRSPIVVGLLNGLMPCGPLQAMQLYALSTGSPVKGALAMFLFSVGTLPLMFGLGALGSLLTRKFRNRIMTAGAALVLILGLFMFSGGWNLSGFYVPSLPGGGGVESGLSSDGSAALVQGDGSSYAVVDGVQEIRSTLQPGSYPAITVTAGMPVTWTIDAQPGSLSGCNNALVIPQYGIEYTFNEGENVIQFEPTETGSFPYSCWMGMIRSTITVVK